MLRLLSRIDPQLVCVLQTHLESRLMSPAVTTAQITSSPSTATGTATPDVRNLEYYHSKEIFPCVETEQ